MPIDKDDAFQRFSDIGDAFDDFRTRWPSAFSVLLWCIGLGVITAVIGISYFIYEAVRTKEWNTQAYAVKSARATTFGPAIVFYVDLENTTEDDLTLSESVRIQTASRENDALQDSAIKLDKPYFIPKGHTSRVTMLLQHACEDGDKAKACYDGNFRDDRALIIFDDLHRIETRIQLPASVPDDTIHVPTPPVSP